MHFFFNKNESIRQQIAEESTTDVTKELARAESLYESEVAKGTVSAQSAFDYAFWLISSPRFDDREKGVVLLKGLHQRDTDNRDYLYFLALGNYKLQDYVMTRRYCDMLLEIEPHNRQALALKSLAEEKVAKDGLVGMVLVGGAAAALVTGLLMLKKR